jgi:hypothetical protein
MTSLSSSQELNKPLKIASVSGILSLLIAIGIIFIGLREYFYPGVAASGFGVPLLDPGDGGFLAIKAARDIAAGVVVLAVLALHNRQFLSVVIGALTLIPLLDGLIVLQHAGWSFTPLILVHWTTAAVMLFIVARLRIGK